ncbi:hypothetical protein CL630_01330 [bacterium]|nr:hypothetical protein [bacterium]|tara:strand:+ start:11302 stop:11820 length:519 start_codon:yes stop_codon:yes gene_type:complete
MITKMDGYLLDNVFQKLVDWFQEKTGKNCFLLAQISLCVILILETIRSISIYFLDNALPDFLTGIVVLCALYLIIRTWQREKDWDENSRETMNHNREGYVSFVRVFIIFIIMLDLILIALLMILFPDQVELLNHLKTIYLIFFVSVMYFWACTPTLPRNSGTNLGSGPGHSF